MGVSFEIDFGVHVLKSHRVLSALYKLFTSRLTLADAGQCSPRKKLITGKLFYNQVVKHLFRNSENASARSDKQRQLTGTKQYV